MAYTKSEWKDHVTSRPNTYSVVENPDGTKTLTPAGEVLQKGSPLSAERFNHMEQGIAEAHEGVAEVQRGIEALDGEKASTEYVNDAINSVSAYYITYDVNGNPFPTFGALSGASVFYYAGKPRVPTKNDYALVLADETHDNAACRYVYTVSDGETTGQWALQYVVNDKPLTEGQLAALNSGFTAADKSTLDTISTPATEEKAGVVKVGRGLEMKDGVLVATGGTPYTYLSHTEYMELPERYDDVLYWVTNDEGKYSLIKNGVILQGNIITLSKFWYDIQKKVRNGTIQDYYSVGDQLSVNYNGSAVMFDIVAFDVATPADSNYTHSMTLIPHDCLESLMFDNLEPSNSNSDRKRYGNNRYLHSNIRKWLNSNGGAGNWWTAQHSADNAPDYAATKAGFMSYFDSDFLSVIGKTKIKVVKNTVTDGGGYEEISDDYFYLPSTTEVGLANENSIAEGTLFPYFDSDAKRIKYYSGSTKYWWLRTPDSGHTNYVRGVSTSGELGSDLAYRSHGIAPACNII